MSKNTNKRALPAIRFPAFQNKGAWLLFKLEDVAKFHKGKGLPKSAICDNGERQCIHYGELFTAYSEVIRSVKNRTNQDNNFISKCNDVLMPTSDITPNGLAKASCLNIGDVVLGGDILIIRTNSSEINGEFLSRFIRKEENQVLKFVTGSTVYHLYGSSLGKLVLSKPEFQEQQKIADCLFSIDELIIAHTQKFEALKAHKKSLMQQLFPAEDETVPKLRFGEFGNKLMQVKFSELVEIKIGLTHKPEYVGSGVPFLSSKNISKGYIDFEDIKYISEEKFSSMPQSTKPRAGDILFTRVGSNLGNPIIFEDNKKFGIFVSLGFIRVNKGVSNYYIKNWMDSDYFWQQVKQKVAGGAKDNLNSTWLKEFELSIPSKEEQKKIAECLSSIDKIISAQVKSIEYLKFHKKALMQQLFPSIDKVGESA